MGSSISGTSRIFQLGTCPSNGSSSARMRKPMIALTSAESTSERGRISRGKTSFFT
ncbi:hypothetical protein D3C78_1863650 [compost metagenome]